MCVLTMNVLVFVCLFVCLFVCFIYFDHFYQIPKERFQTSFYPSLLALANDKVPNIRLAVARLSHAGWLNTEEKGNTHELRSIVTNHEHNDRDAVFFALKPELRENLKYLDYSSWRTREERYQEEHGEGDEKGEEEEEEEDEDEDEEDDDDDDDEEEEGEDEDGKGKNQEEDREKSGSDDVVL